MNVGANGGALGIRARVLPIILIGMLALCTVWAGMARADSTVNVNTTSDAPAAGQCSLREAVLYANGTAQPACAPGSATGTTTINVPAGTYTLSGSGLSVTAPIVINGAGAASTTISGGGSVQVLNVASGVQATVSSLTISGGLSGVPTTGCSGSGLTETCPAETGNDGGGIANAGRLTLSNVVVTNNKASGGTLPRTGILIIRCFFIGGQFSCFPEQGQSAGSGGRGGGIYNSGQLTIQSSTISGNAAGAGGSGTDGESGTGADVSAGQPGGSGGEGGGGGGIYNDFGATLVVTSSLITGNAAGNGGNAGAGSNATTTGTGGDAGFPGFGGDGGGIENDGNITVSATTVSGNKSGSGGNGASGGTGDGAANGFGSSGASAGNGGGYDNDSASATKLTNVTLTADQTQPGGTGPAGNGANGAGGAVNQYGSGLVALTFDTIAGNTAVGTGGGINTDFGGVVTEANTIAAGNSAATGLNCRGANGAVVSDDGFNLVFGDNSCPGKNGDPRLGALSANGGPVPTMALGSGSAALDLVPVSSCGFGGVTPVDARGISRPQGAACDAGAYEVAPPSVSSPADTAVATTAGIVSATVNPNLRDTTVTVRYGTSTAYGSTTSAQDVGAGSQPVRFTAPIGGLTPGTTYHAQIVATNGDGTTTTGDLTFRTPSSVGASMSAPVIIGDVLTTTITCSAGNATDVCSGPVALTSHVTTQAGQPVAVSAATGKHKPHSGKSKGKGKRKGKGKTKPKTTAVVTLAATSYSVPTGHSQTLTLRINTAAVKLLNHFYRLPATLSIGGTSPFTTPVLFQYARLHISPVFTWAFNRTFTKALQLTVSPMPPHGKLEVICHGGGCPFSRHSFSGKRKINLLSALKGKHLRPHATLQLRITAPDTVGEVVTFAIRASKSPMETFSCLPPGARTPSACM